LYFEARAGGENRTRMTRIIRVIRVLLTKQSKSARFYHFPIHYFPQFFQVIAATVPKVKIIGMFPNVEA
jgi:hypothetical protein